jgi:hypothetical protein
MGLEGIWTLGRRLHRWAGSDGPRSMRSSFAGGTRSPTAYLAPRFAEGNSGVAAMGLVAAGGAFAVGVQFREVS